MKPLFLFSLPRSGSTLLQRMLAASPQVATASEPWLLLPLLHPLRSARGVTEYGNWTLAQAISDFCATLDGGRASYLREAAGFTQRLYESSAANKGARYFLDKTPRYHLIVEEIIQAFDDARFILLWRNPLAVTASMMQTWCEGRWCLHHFHADLHAGLENLLRCQERNGDRLLILRFEDLVADTEGEIQRVCDHLEIPADPAMTGDFANVRLDGRLGDPTGIHDYDAVSPEAAAKWKLSYSNPLRRRWARQYLDWIGAERLQAMGYDHAQLVSDLNGAEAWFGRLASDIWRMPYSGLRRRFLDWTLERKWP